jgi:CBS domain-containing protein
MLCREAMKMAVTTCRTSTRVVECAKLMAEHDIGFVPVVDENAKLVGVVTDRDLALRVLGKDRTGLTPVEQVMTTSLVTCGPDDSLRFAEDRLAEAKKSRIVVVESDGTVAGVLSLSDIGRLEEPERAGEVFKDVTRREATGVIGARR